MQVYLHIFRKSNFWTDFGSEPAQSIDPEKLKSGRFEEIRASILARYTRAHSWSWQLKVKYAQIMTQKIVSRTLYF